MSRRIKDEAGYSLVEVMVAIMILAIAIIPMVGMFDAGLRAAALGGNYDMARALANEKLEEAKSLPFSEVLTRYPEGTPAPCNPTPPAGSPFTSCEVRTQYVFLDSGAVEAPPAGLDETTMLQVTVTVGWDSGGPYTTTGLIAK